MTVGVFYLKTLVGHLLLFLTQNVFMTQIFFLLHIGNIGHIEKLCVLCYLCVIKKNHVVLEESMPILRTRISTFRFRPTDFTPKIISHSFA